RISSCVGLGDMTVSVGCAGFEWEADGPAQDARMPTRCAASARAHLNADVVSWRAGHVQSRPCDVRLRLIRSEHPGRPYRPRLRLSCWRTVILSHILPGTSPMSRPPSETYRS